MKNKKDIIYIGIIIFLLIGTVFMFNKLSNISDKFDRYETTISALNDSVHVALEGKNTIYYQKSPEIDIKDLVNSEYFKTLSADQQAYYNELSKIKGLISSSKAELEKQGELIALLMDHSGTLKNDSISFKAGTVLAFKELDTTKKLQWNSSITLDDEVKFKFNYDYKFNIQTTYERQKDKSIVVKYKIDDPDLKVNKMYNYTIPVETKNGFQKWFDKNKKPIAIIGGSVLFVGGGIAGYTLAK